MNDIHILVTMPQHAVFRTFFDADAMAALEHIGTVHWNTLGRQYTQDELGAAVRGMDICVTGWGTPVFDEAVLAQADRLRLIAHTGGSVKPYVTDAVYGRGIRVVSGNEVFAESVAESVVAYALASLRQIPYHSVNLSFTRWSVNQLVFTPDMPWPAAYGRRALRTAACWTAAWALWATA